jgi:hypothetical protein
MSTTEDVVKRAKQLGIKTKGRLKSELIAEIQKFALKKVREQLAREIESKKKTPPKKAPKTFDVETAPKPGGDDEEDEGSTSKGPIRSSVLTVAERSFARALVITALHNVDTVLNRVYNIKLRTGRAAEEMELFKAMKRAAEQWKTWDVGEDGPTFL